MKIESYINKILFVLIIIYGFLIFYVYNERNPSTETLLGVDANNDGIRDDVYEYIQTLNYPEQQGRLLKEWAKLYQLILRDSENEELSIEHSYRSSHLHDCFFYFWKDDRKYTEVMGDLDSIILNNAARRISYKDYDRHLGGQAYGLFQDEFREVFCNRPDFNEITQYNNKGIGLSFEYPLEWDMGYINQPFSTQLVPPTWKIDYYIRENYRIFIAEAASVPVECSLTQSKDCVEKVNSKGVKYITYSLTNSETNEKYIYFQVPTEMTVVQFLMKSEKSKESDYVFSVLKEIIESIVLN